MSHRFQIGTKFMTRGKHPVQCTVIDHLTTTNSAGVVVRERYVATHLRCAASSRTLTITPRSRKSLQKLLAGGNGRLNVVRHNAELTGLRRKDER